MYIVFIAMIASAIGITGWMYFVQKDFPFVVEAACDPDAERCFYRACSDTSNTGDCPPNALEYYKIYTITAHDFGSCRDNSCAPECAAGSIECEQWECGESEEDICSDTVIIEEHDQLDTEAVTE